MDEPSAAVVIRAYDPGDAAATARVAFEAIREGTRQHYDTDQREAWAPAVPDLQAWTARIAQQTAFVALRGGQCVGVMSVRRDGVLDLAFVAPSAARQGLGGRLYDAVLAAARRQGFTHLTTQASLVSWPFFAQRGWTVVCDRQVLRNGVHLRSFAMYLKVNP